MTIKSLLDKGLDFLGSRPNALLDSELVLAYVLDCEREFLIANFSQQVSEDLVNLFHLYLERLKNGEPVAYILHEKEFFGLSFYVDQRVLIPRPETEHLVERVIAFIEKNIQPGKRFRILDVGTGSANIPVAVAKYFQDKGLDYIEYIDAIDIDAGALEVAGINIQQYGLEDRIRLIESNLLDLIDEGEYYDIIVANLPYIGSETNRFVSRDTEKYEPNVALFGGNTGLELYKKMFQQIQEKNIGYRLIVGEFGFAQSESLSGLLSNYFEHNWLIDKDLADIDRMFVITK